VQGNYPLTQDPEHDVRHIILDFQGRPFPVLEGQSLGILAPGEDCRRQGAFAPALFCVKPAGRRAARVSQCVFDREARGTGRVLQLHL